MKDPPMPTIISTTTTLIPTEWGVFPLQNSFDTEWERSPRGANGELLLRSNPMTRQRLGHTVRVKTQKGFDHTQRMAQGPSGTFGPARLQRFTDGIDSIALAKFRGKLYKGKASLGVTVASWRQAADSITSKAEWLRKRTSYWEPRLKTSRGRQLEKALSSFHLEVIFGWVPLYEDIHAAVKTVVDHRFTEWEQVASTHQGYDRHRWSLYEGNNVTAYYDTEVTYKSKVSAQVQVDNLNQWLASRAGLTSYGAIVWDLVPWSFVVNMFVNTGQLAQSLTDYAGLSFKEQAVTTMLRSGYDITRREDVGGTQVLSSIDTGVTSQKRRVVGSIPRPNLVFRIPDVNMFTATMAMSLVTQRFRTLSRLLPDGLTARGNKTPRKKG